MAEYRLWFFVEGKDVYHNIIISQGCDVADLKAKIHEVGRHDYWIGVGIMGLVLFQVDIDPTPHEGKIRELRAPDDARIMDGPMELIQQLWPVEPTKGHLHICVRLPSALGKRKVEDETERGKSFKLARTELHKPDSSIEPNKLQAARDLYDIVWGHPLKEVVLTVRSQQDVWEYVPLENVEKLGLNFLGFTGRVLLFRQEYITAFDLLGLGPSMRREDSVVITGHSGIGKTSFSYYVLLRRLSSKSPTALQLTDGCILFDEGGPQEFSRSPKHTVALADSTAASREPCAAFQDAAKARVVRVIQTTSAPKNWSRWHEEVSANQYVMDYFSSEELDILGNILGLNCDVLRRIYNTWGPSTRNCVHLTQYPGQEGPYADEVEIAVRTFVRKFQHSPTYIDPFAESHKIISVRPRGKGLDEGRSRLTARVATRRIERMILLQSIKAEVAEQILFYKMLSRHKWFGSPTGYMLKNYVLACLSARPTSKPLPCIAADSGPSTLEIPVSLPKQSFKLNSAASLNDVNNHTLPFCLIPSSSNYVAFDAIVCSEDSFFTIQVTVSSTHSADPEAFAKLRRDVPSLFLANRTWYHVFVTTHERKAEKLRNMKLKNLPAEVTIYSAVFDVDRLGSIHERLVEMCKKKGGDTKEEIIHGHDDESDTVMLTYPNTNQNCARTNTR